MNQFKSIIENKVNLLDKRKNDLNKIIKKWTNLIDDSWFFM